MGGSSAGFSILLSPRLSFSNSVERRVSTAGVARRGNTVFLARRKSGGALSRKWEFPGGKVDSGETPSQGLLREMEEEFGMAVEILGGPFCRGSFRHRETAFELLAFPISFEGEPPCLNEHEEFRWVEITQLPAYDIAPSDQCIVEALLGGEPPVNRYTN